MNRIRLLSEQVANQIAAGEVVERPASVVKELVENALDAQAGRITVEIQAGGRSLIRVTDDGMGMSRDDALLCLERHATSKIIRAEDLHAISTMGFRGEALPSIASVCRFTLTTRERDTGSPEGTQIIVNGGKVAGVNASGAPTGTCIEVRQLFFNLPARRKFLRSDETESAHIQHYLLVAALAHPQVAFEFYKDTRLVWQLPAVKADTLLDAAGQRLRALYGGQDRWIQVDYKGQLPPGRDEIDSQTGLPTEAAPEPLRVWGYIGAPGISRSTREDQHIYVNRRPVDNRGVNYALIEGYHTALMKGRYPVCCLFLELSPAEVDVNIHPSKREVKFHRERAVREQVAQAVRQALLASGNTSAQPSAPRPVDTNIFPALAPATDSTPEAAPALQLAATPTPEPEPSDLPNFPSVSKPPAPWPVRPEPTLTPSAQEPSQIPTIEPCASVQPETKPASSSLVPPHLPLRVVGVLGNLYVVLESDRGMVLMDQHAAHERVLFEQMLNRLEQQGQAPSQRLLLPETVELSTRDAAFLRGQLPALARLGIGLGEFGDRTFLLEAVPPFVDSSSSRQFVIELVDELKAAGQGVNNLRLGEHVIAKTVCRHAVKAHDPLSVLELEKLIEDLRQCALPYTCPHGRPTLIEMSFRELEKKFGRIA